MNQIYHCPYQGPNALLLDTAGKRVSLELVPLFTQSDLIWTDKWYLAFIKNKKKKHTTSTPPNGDLALVATPIYFVYTDGRGDRAKSFIWEKINKHCSIKSMLWEKKRREATSCHQKYLFTYSSKLHQERERSFRSSSY